ncbi:conserved unknown protein [Ectocarpus siliculosus]|uniref:Palmitoyltransferase n=1 Tax=Ectocarpus siliculosus TaxID=2880 RepID=D7FV32_ECTSI|nr:conserved unknown protein [Ectocarpus siliculosus]|eukprot:CBJ31838.1 conserved unknown protein [Ectocarpus siliculosus]
MPLDGSRVQGTVGRSCVVTAVAQKGTWLQVRVGGAKEGWMQSQFSDGTVTLAEVDSYRRHEEWGGFNHFFLGGRVMMGSDVRWFLSSNITLTVPSMLFIWEMFQGFPVRGGTILGWIGVSMWAFAMLSLWMTALTDPGIIPRNPSNERAPPPVGEAIGLHGFKYCETCNIFRPPRSKHCQSCNNCVDRFDHHCPWVGSCVAVRNYRYFFAFVGSTALLIFFMMAAVLARLVLRVLVDGDGSVESILEVVASGPVDLLMTAMALLVGIPLLRLWWYHLQTILCKGQTTNEDMRAVYRNHHNSYHKGCWQNSVSLLCAPAPRSRLPDLSERVYVNEPLASRGSGTRWGDGERGSRTFSWISPAGGFGFLGDSDGDCSDQRRQHQQHQQQGRPPRVLSAGGSSRRTNSAGSFASASSFVSSAGEALSDLSELSVGGGGGEGPAAAAAAGGGETPVEAVVTAAVTAAASEYNQDGGGGGGGDGGDEDGEEEEDANANASSTSEGPREEEEKGVEEAAPTLAISTGGELQFSSPPAGDEKREAGREGAADEESPLLGAPEPPRTPPSTASASSPRAGDVHGTSPTTAAAAAAVASDALAGAPAQPAADPNEIDNDNPNSTIPTIVRHLSNSTDNSWHGQAKKVSSPLVGLSYTHSPLSVRSMSDDAGSGGGGGGGSRRGSARASATATAAAAAAVAAAAAARDGSHSSGELTYSPNPSAAAPDPEEEEVVPWTKSSSGDARAPSAALFSEEGGGDRGSYNNNNARGQGGQEAAAGFFPLEGGSDAVLPEGEAAAAVAAAAAAAMGAAGNRGRDSGRRSDFRAGSTSGSPSPRRDGQQRQHLLPLEKTLP